MDEITYTEEQVREALEYIETPTMISEAENELFHLLDRRARILAAALRDARERLVEMRNAAFAYRELLACYRIGRQPTEKLWARLDKANALLRPLPPEEV